MLQNIRLRGVSNVLAIKGHQKHLLILLSFQKYKQFTTEKRFSLGIKVMLSITWTYKSSPDLFHSLLVNKFSAEI